MTTAVATRMDLRAIVGMRLLVKPFGEASKPMIDRASLVLLLPQPIYPNHYSREVVQ